MATHLSQQMNYKLKDGCPGMRSNELAGRLRCLWWEFNPTDDGGVTLAADDKVTLGIIPAGARIVRGRCYNGAFGAASDSGVVLSIGLRATDGSGYLNVAGTDADDADALMDAVDVDEAATTDFANTEALHMGYVTEKECYVEALWETANPEDGDLDMDGYLLYVVD